MPRPHSPAVIAAIADIDAGMTAYAAAKKHGVQQSSISRALKRRSNLCPCCGHVGIPKRENIMNQTTEDDHCKQDSLRLKFIEEHKIICGIRENGYWEASNDVVWVSRKTLTECIDVLMRSDCSDQILTK